MSEQEAPRTRGRQKGETFASASDVFMAALSGAKELRELSEETSISYNALVTAKEMLEKAGKSVPKEMDAMILERIKPSTGKEERTIGETFVGTISGNRGHKPVVFQIPLAAYAGKAFDWKGTDDEQRECWITLEKDQVVIRFKKPK